MAFRSGTPFKHLRQVGLGLASRDTLKRVEAVELLLSWLLHRLSDEQRAEHFGFAPALSAAHMPDARLYPDRKELLHALPRGGRVAEVGTQEGEFAKRIGAICAPDELHLIDIDLSVLDRAGVRASFGGRLLEYEGDSAVTLRTFSPGSFDWLYIDADHRYTAVSRDLAMSHVALRPGGFLMCNDYTNWDIGSAQPYGVARAVNELCLEHNYQVLGLAFERAGYYDILIQKPG
jgi:hypothetical protein